MEHIVAVAEFLINGQWVVIRGWEPRMVDTYATCLEFLQAGKAYVEANPHPDAEEVRFVCLAPVMDSFIQFVNGRPL